MTLMSILVSVPQNLAINRLFNLQKIIDKAFDNCLGLCFPANKQKIVGFSFSVVEIFWISVFKMSLWSVQNKTDFSLFSTIL